VTRSAFLDRCLARAVRDPCRPRQRCPSRPRRCRRSDRLQAMTSAHLATLELQALRVPVSSAASGPYQGRVSLAIVFPGSSHGRSLLLGSSARTLRPASRTMGSTALLPRTALAAALTRHRPSSSSHAHKKEHCLVDFSIHSKNSLGLSFPRTWLAGSPRLSRCADRRSVLRSERPRRPRRP
jgi:hypothetical protein